jgi:signal transduction histidine kinase
MTTAALEAVGSTERSADPPSGQIPGRGQQPDQPMTLMSRFQLRNWRVRQRVGVLVLLPTVAAVVLGGVRIEAARDTASVFARVHALASLGQNVTTLAESIEDERDLSGGAIAAKQSGDKAEASTISSALTSQYATTNSDITAMDAAASMVSSTDLSNAQVELSSLADVRGLLSTGMGPLPVLTDYTSIISALLTFDGDLAAGSSSPQLAQTVSSLEDLAQAEDEASQQRAILYATLVQNSFGLGALQELIDAQAAQNSDQASFQSVGQNLPAGPSSSLTEAQQFNNVVSGPDIDAAEAIEQNALVSGDSNAPLIQPSGGPQAWFTDMTQELTTLRQVEGDILQSSVTQAATLQQDSESSERLTAIIVLILLVLVLAITVLIARSMVVPLRRLRADALDVAGRRLPEVVRRLSESQDVDNDVKIELIGINSADEIGEVARAFDQVHREAVRLAGDEALLRANLNAMFVNLSRRSQTLIERQLGIIDRLEQSEQDSDRLSSLFRLDHLATRMRRNSENLLVLAGHEAPRKWTEPVPLVDVLRAAVSEIEQYERINLSVQPGVMVAGRIASDVVHLVAELVENATVFSAEDTQVLITSQRLVSGGVLLNITDAGLGIPDQDLSYANWRLDNPPVVDVAVSRRMGLFVVGRLAARHGIRVRLQHAAGGGLIALVWLPETVAEPDTITPPRQLPRRSDGDARNTTVDGYRTVNAGFGSAGDDTMADVASTAPRRSVTRAQSSGSFFAPVPAARETPSGLASRPVSAPPAPAQTVLPAAPSPVVPAAPQPAGPVTAPPVVPGPESGSRAEARGGRLPIFDSVESDWFRRGGPPLTRDSSPVATTSGSWTSPADDGFRAAQAAASPATGEVTTAGLPKRVPSANLVPGKVGHDQAPPARTQSPAASPALRTAEDVRKAADAVRNRMTGLQRGAREGRAAAAPAEDYETNEN